jgi:tetratricopeptide (TPR) repeat protein
MKGMTMRTQVLCATALALCMLASGSARADGGGGGGGSQQQTCPRGYVYDSSSNRCVPQHASVLSDDALAEYAYALIKQQRYQDALAVLELVKNPNNAVALNYRGYATRKLGRLDEGIGYYLKSVSLDPHYAKVREYLGEAYLVKGDPASARAQLQAIKGICGTTCESYEHLAIAIADPADL